MFGNTSTDDFEDEEVHDPGYRPPQALETPQAFPTVAQPAQPNNYPFAAPAQLTWQQPHTSTAATPSASVPQPFAQPVAPTAASIQPQSTSGPGRRIPAAWGGTASTLAPASTALPTKPAQPTAAPLPLFTAPQPLKPLATTPSPFIPIAAPYTPNSIPTTHSALPTVHISHPVKDSSVALPTPVTSAVNTSTYKGPSAFSNGESYFDDED